MKLLDRLISFIFSLIILVLSVTVILVGLGYVSSDNIYSIMHQYVFASDVQQTALIVACAFALAVLKVTIFNSSFKSKSKEPIYVETNHGVIEISPDTIENTVRSVANEFPEIKEVQARMIKKNKGIKIFTVISVLANTNIRALTGELQEKIEEVIDETTGIKTLSTNIRVKNVYEKTKKVVKSELKVVTEAKNENIAVAPSTKEEEHHEELTKEEIKNDESNNSEMEG